MFRGTTAQDARTREREKRVIAQFASKNCTTKTNREDEDVARRMRVRASRQGNIKMQLNQWRTHGPRHVPHARTDVCERINRARPSASASRRRRCSMRMTENQQTTLYANAVSVSVLPKDVRRRACVRTRHPPNAITISAGRVWSGQRAVGRCDAMRSDVSRALTRQPVPAHNVAETLCVCRRMRSEASVSAAAAVICCDLFAKAYAYHVCEAPRLN